MREFAFLNDIPVAPVTVPLPLQPCVPTWVEEATADGRVTTFITVVRDAAAMAADALRASVGAAYQDLGAAVRRAGKSPIRVWNYMPDPAAVMGPGLDRYMVFNAGRYDGYQQWQRSGGSSRSLPTASGVGIIGTDLTIQCLASHDGGIAIENPRQTPAWRYSARYGPEPPCFARATIATVHGRRRLLIGGTASIVGEDSCHERNAEAQLDETLANLAALIAAARQTDESGAASLARLTDLRVYIVNTEDAPMIESVLRARCVAAHRVEHRVARLCRPELLVEIEGVADL